MSRKRRVEIDDLFEYRFPSSPALSADGGLLAFVVQQADASSNSYRSNLWLSSLDLDATKQLTNGGSDSSPLWLGSGEILFVSKREVPGQPQSKPTSPRTSFFRISPHGGEATHAFTVERSVSWIRELHDGRFLMLSSWEREPLPELAENETRVHVFDEVPIWANGTGFSHGVRRRLSVFDPDTGAITDLTPPELSCGSADISPDQGRAVVSAETVEGIQVPGGRLFLVPIPERSSGEDAAPESVALTPLAHPATPTEEPAATLPAGCFESPVFVSESLIASLFTDVSRYGRLATAALCFVGADSGEARLGDAPPELEPGKSSVGTDVRTGASASGLVAAGDSVFLAGTSGYVCDLYRAGTTGFSRVTGGAGSVVAFSAVDRGGSPVVATIEMSATSLPEVWVRDGGKPRRMSSLNTEYVRAIELCRPRHFSIESNGENIDAWIMLPPGEGEGSVPSILNIHGGPRTAYGELFFHEMQVWAARGFAVITCNPHGSDGRGNEFADIRGAYGSKDYEDIMAVLDAALERHPQLDPARVCITGGSYGGFMTNWAIGHTGRFCAAASQRSISNWTAFWGTSDIGYWFAEDQLAGTPWSQPARYHDLSPLSYADRITTPTLFLHSDADHRCRIQDALQMHTALCYHGIESRFVWVEGENHELSRGGKPLARQRRLHEITSWFERHTGLSPASPEKA